MKRLDDRTAVVTGAASGIGRAVAVRLASKGCDLALADIDGEALDETIRRVEAKGRRASRHVVDVSQLSQMERFAADVEREHGGAQVLVNNAGVAVGKTFEEHTLDDFEWLLGINLWGVIYGCRLFLPMLERADEGHIVNISSIFGVVGMPMNSSYCASKFAVRGLSESLRVELESKNVGVTSVHPGGVATNVVARGRFSETLEGRKAQAQSIEMFKRFMPPEQAAVPIVRAIERNEPRVLITREARVLDGLARLSPRALHRILLRRWRRYLETGEVAI
ncbi:MAG: SDR family NAD(P)-dependent oxidoreductase [Polyangiales bacterium]